MAMNSIWSKTVDAPPARPALEGSHTADVAVIGGGLAGILTAYFLKQAGRNPVVLEARQVGGGQTQNTTAKVTSQHGLIYGMLLEKFGEDRARQYLHANQTAVERYRQIIREKGIACDWEECPAYLYSTLDEKPLQMEEKAARVLGMQADFTTETELPFRVKGALRFEHQARFHPLKFLYAVASDCTVYENTPVLEVDKQTLKTEHGELYADEVVFATHFPFVNHPGYYFARMHQERSYAIALHHAPRMEGVYLGVDGEGLSFRSAQDCLVLGGGSHRTGENSKGGQYELLKRRAGEFWPGSKEVALWSAQDCISIDGVPYIGPYASAAPNWYVATGFGKWGMTSSMAAASILTHAILGKKDPDAEVFSPQRFVLSASAKTLLQDSAKAVQGITRGFLSIPPSEMDALPCGHGGVVEYEGEAIGVYKEEDGTSHLVSARCPHLGCRLEWNPDEKSWDCPCHGSRFDFYGNLIDNPAQEGLQHA